MEDRGWAHCKACDNCYSPRINETCYRESGRVEYEVLCPKCLGIAEETAGFLQRQWEEIKNPELDTIPLTLDEDDSYFLRGFFEDAGANMCAKAIREGE